MNTPTDAENIHQVFDWLWSSGQLSEDDIACLPALGIEAVINLAPPTSSNALPGEAELVTLQGIAYVQIPVAWERPELRQLDQFFGTLRAFEGRKVWVHCAKNMRVSAFIYLYRRMRHSRCARSGCRTKPGKPSFAGLWNRSCRGSKSGHSLWTIIRRNALRYTALQILVAYKCHKCW